MSTPSKATPTHTRAWRIHKPGLIPQVMQLDEEVKLPQLKTGQLLVKVDKAGINPVDWKQAVLMPSFIQSLPRCPATDFSGTIVAIGPPPTAKDTAAAEAAKTFNFEVGQPVWGTFKVDPPGPQGSLQDYIVVKLDRVAPRPSQIDPTSAAGMPIPALTALALARYAKKGDKVLLLGGSTSVGLFLADILKSPSVGVSHIVATASGSKISILERRGKIDAFIDYRSGSVEGQLKEQYPVKDDGKAFDVILDCVGSNATYDSSPSYLKTAGVYVNAGASYIEPGKSTFSLLPTLFWVLKATALPKAIGGTPRKYVLVAPPQDAKSKKELNALIEQGCLDPLTDSVFGFKEANKAYEKLMTNRAMGKVIIDVLKD